MAAIVKIANTIVKGKTNEVVAQYLESLGDEWKTFSEGELKSSNENNTKSLGGQQPRPQPNDDDEMDSSTSMESILSRFAQFSSDRSKRESQNNNDDDDDEDNDDDDEGQDEEQKKEEPAKEAPVEQSDNLTFLKERDASYEGSSEIATTVAENAPIVKEYADNNYWKVDLYQDVSLDDLMAELGQ